MRSDQANEGTTASLHGCKIKPIMITRHDHAPGTAGLNRQRKAPFLRVAVGISYAMHIYRRVVRDCDAKNPGAVSS
jgi:hypothetical protein